MVVSQKRERAPSGSVGCNGGDECLFERRQSAEEGDQWNAEYWYKRAGKLVFRGAIADESEVMVATLLSQ
jgi:hypothetical protein